MQVAPSLHLRVEQFTVWHTALALLGPAAVLPVVLWLVDANEANSVTPDFACPLAALLAVVVLAACWAARRVPAFELVWDESSWRLRQPACPPAHVVGTAAEASFQQGELNVALDLGHFMILQFVAHGHRKAQLFPRWLPVQRRGLEAQWHALRCTVYSPRPTRAAHASRALAGEVTPCSAP